MHSKEDAVVLSLKQRFKALYGHAYAEAPLGVTLRRARADDYDDVMAINKDFVDGLDLLPELYHTHVQDPDCYMFVAVKDNRVVSFLMQQVFDNGKATMGRSARTLPQYKEQGIYKALRSYAALTTWKERPTIRMGRGHSGHPTFMINKLKSRPTSHARIIETKVFRAFADGLLPADLEGVCTEEFTQQLTDQFPGISDAMRDLTSADKDRLVSILSDREAVKRLFPAGVISYGFRCHAASVENITTAGLLDHRCHVFVDDAGQMFFLSYIYQCQAGLAAEFGFYGNASVEYIVAALLKTIPLIIPEYKKGKIHIYGGFEEGSVAIEALERHLSFPPFHPQKLSFEKGRTMEVIFPDFPNSNL